MESKTARLTVLVDPEKKKALERLCASQDLTPSQVVRQLIRDYLAEHRVSYGPDSATEDGTPPVNNPVVSRRGRPSRAKGASGKAG